MRCMIGMALVFSNAVAVNVQKLGSGMWFMAYASQREHLPVPAAPRSRKLQDSPGMVPAVR